MNNQGSPGTRSLMFNGRDKASEVALRRQLQEKEREAKLEAKKKEQEERMRRIAEQKNNELQLKMKMKAQKELEKAKAVLDRRAQQLELDRAKKQAVLEKAHLATSRTAQLSPKKVFAFGSSTPRELTYLEKLSKDQKQYNKKLVPSDGSTGVSPSSSPPRQLNTKKNAMTSSLYVPARSNPVKNVSQSSHAPSPKKAPNNNSMTQSLYVPSKVSQPLRRNPLPTKPVPPMRNQTANSPNKKPPIPNFKKLAPKKASTGSPSVSSKTDMNKQQPTDVNSTTKDLNVENFKNPHDSKEINLSQASGGIMEQKDSSIVLEKAAETVPIIPENEGPDASPFVQLISEPTLTDVVTDDNKMDVERLNEHHVPEVIDQEADHIADVIIESVVDTLSQSSVDDNLLIVNEHIGSSTEENKDDVHENQLIEESVKVECGDEKKNVELDGLQNLVFKEKSAIENNEINDSKNSHITQSIENLDLSDKPLSKEVDGLDTYRVEKDETIATSDNENSNTRIESPDSGNALSASSSPKESDSENTEITAQLQINHKKAMERRARLSEIMSKVRGTASSPVVAEGIDKDKLAKQLLEQRRQGRNITPGSDSDLFGNSSEVNKDDVTVSTRSGLSLAEELKEAERQSVSSDILPGQPIYDNYNSSTTEEPVHT